MKNIVGVTFLLSSFFIGEFAVADSIAIENKDKLNVKVMYGDTVYRQSNEERLYDARNPKEGEEWIRIVASDSKESEDFLDLKLRSSFGIADASRGCNYSLLVTESSGWKLVGQDSGECSRSQNNYKPEASHAHAYTVRNESEIPVYPAFSVEKDNDFSSDSVLGYLKSGESRVYSKTTGYWKSVNVKDNVQVGFYNPYTTSYVKCSNELESIDKEREFVFTKNHQCEKAK
ncbi:hypothetical protein FZZ93_02235 [Halomonas eurihalina]|uniref:Uncharacterized protein n=1 Tax=Halomonas eurihalina TaxID=42566 RepID=A0A5D9DDC5_HALER|nr:hypothetical protein [Halomonas eurihalina]MDR5857986.1 hypothetical protein [Halomonas eurihalina]TZG41503.1 hypothetical protein FZZ93_02235 [Halomonas eurihalina]